MEYETDIILVEIKRMCGNRGFIDFDHTYIFLQNSFFWDTIHIEDGFIVVNKNGIRTSVLISDPKSLEIAAARLLET